MRLENAVFAAALVIGLTSGVSAHADEPSWSLAAESWVEQSAPQAATFDLSASLAGPMEWAPAPMASAAAFEVAVDGLGRRVRTGDARMFSLDQAGRQLSAGE